MKFVTLLLAIGLSHAVEDPLRKILQSPKATLKLYNDFKANEHLSFNLNEDRSRFRLFKHQAELVATYNEAEDETATFGLNFFATMTPEEKQQYLGLNITGHEPNAEPEVPMTAPTSGSVLWVNKNAVTKVKNQGSCGSCWTYGAVGGLETHYYNKVGKLKSFSEQEWLDCVYEGRRDGCKGGWMKDCYDYSQKVGGRLATNRDYPYTARDGRCQSSSKRNGLIAQKIARNVPVGRGESSNINALRSGALAVAFEVTNKCHSYRSGIFRDTTCRGSPNHAVTAVGYTPQFVLVKNSWGGSWGDRGFIKFARNHGNCGLFDYSSYPQLTSTGRQDSDPADAATSYRVDENNPDPDPQPDPDCKDIQSDRYCQYYKRYCSRSDTIKKYCRKTCGLCDDSDGGDCPGGTIRCPDGVCRHEHMC